MLALSLMAGTLLSEDLACIAAGLLVREGRIGLGAAVASCSVGIFAGDIGLWAAGCVCRRMTDRSPLLTRLVSGLPLGAAQRRLAHRASAAVLASRFLPGTRVPLYISAGFLGVPLGTFAWWTAIAVVAWTPLLVVGTAGVGGAATAQLAAATGSAWSARVTGALITVAAFAAARRLIVTACRLARAGSLGRWSRWEFWPMWLFYAPVAAWIAALAVRHHGVATITAANPGIPDGGTVGESKFAILSRLPPESVIPSGLVPPGPHACRVAAARALARAHGWPMPLVLKPDVGQRGVGVRLARSDADLERYLAAQPGPVLVQPYHPGPCEAGIFYYRFPGAASGRILSITDKHFPAVVGDGQSTLEELIAAHPRFRLQARTFLRRHHAARGRIIPAGERFQLAIAGNHAQGAMFRDGMHLWTPALERRIDRIAQAFGGFYVGRFDVRYSDVEQFRDGRGLAIVELNGATAESTDIYDPSRSLLSAYRRLFEQWSLVFAIGAANRAAGAPVSSMRRLAALARAHLRTRVAFELSD